jgi:hypothetical protein
MAGIRSVPMESRDSAFPNRRSTRVLEAEYENARDTIGSRTVDAKPSGKREGSDEITAVDDVRLPSIGQQPVAVPL